MDQSIENFSKSRILTETDNSYVYAATSENTRMAYQSVNVRPNTSF